MRNTKPKAQLIKEPFCYKRSHRPASAAKRDISIAHLNHTIFVLYARVIPKLIRRNSYKLNLQKSALMVSI